MNIVFLTITTVKSPSIKTIPAVNRPKRKIIHSSMQMIMTWHLRDSKLVHFFAADCAYRPMAVYGIPAGGEGGLGIHVAASSVHETRAKVWRSVIAIAQRPAGRNGGDAAMPDADRTGWDATTSLGGYCFIIQCTIIYGGIMLCG